MIPLWTTTIRPVQSRCGWAFSSVGRPCVAQRVCPMPYSPATGFRRMGSSRLRSFPEARRTVRHFPPCRTAIPAESYPRYSRRLKPSRMMGTAFCCPMYPTIPHILVEELHSIVFHYRVCKHVAGHLFHFARGGFLGCPGLNFDFEKL